MMDVTDAASQVRLGVRARNSDTHRPGIASRGGKGLNHPQQTRAAKFRDHSQANYILIC